MKLSDGSGGRWMWNSRSRKEVFVQQTSWLVLEGFLRAAALLEFE